MVASVRSLSMKKVLHLVDRLLPAEPSPAHAEGSRPLCRSATDEDSRSSCSCTCRAVTVEWVKESSAAARFNPANAFASSIIDAKQSAYYDHEPAHIVKGIVIPMNLPKR